MPSSRISPNVSKEHHYTYVNATDLYAKVSTPKEHITLQPVLKFNGNNHINDSLFREGANG
ncbi:hypothetical protein C8R44DRAFT_624010 [Mycena epipterygia]|nr:hypothetical protein C8R44DRAFT_624010 [Mycena epipterygia]